MCIIHQQYRIYTAFFSDKYAIRIRRLESTPNRKSSVIIMSLNIDTSNTISGSKEQPQLERIADFYAGTSVFVTGGTGYLGKVIVEKLLRTCTGVRSVYVLLRPKRGKAPEQRLQDMIQTELFRVLRDKYADRLQKLKYIEGDMLADGLGMSVEATQLFRTEISVVVHSAATIRFDEPMRTAIDMNVLSLRRLMDLCGECHALKVRMEIRDGVQ